MAERKVMAKARVQVVLEIELTDSWGADCTVSQVHDQATEAARGEVQKLLEAKAQGSSKDALVIPDPSVYRRIRLLSVKPMGVITEDRS